MTVKEAKRSIRAGLHNAGFNDARIWSVPILEGRTKINFEATVRGLECERKFEIFLTCIEGELKSTFKAGKWVMYTVNPNRHESDGQGAMPAMSRYWPEDPKMGSGASPIFGLYRRQSKQTIRGYVVIE